MNARATRGPQRGAGRRPTHSRTAGPRKISTPPNLGGGPPTRNGGCAVVILGAASAIGLISAALGAAYAGGWLS